MHKAHYCTTCDDEFSVICNAHQTVHFCPFCSEELDVEEEYVIDSETEDYFNQEFEE